ncbi:MAG: glycosyltransferase [Elusimicrobiota bacterium]
MNAKDTLFLSANTDVSAPMGTDLVNAYTREFIKNGQYFLDYPKLYSELGNSGIEQYILDFIDKNKIKILIFVWADSWGFEFRVEFFELLRQKVFLAMMLFDWDHWFDIKDIYYAQVADLIIVPDVVGRFTFKHWRINAITFCAFDTAVYHKLNNISQDIDVSFVGSLVKYGRKDSLDYLVKNGINVQQYGLGTLNSRISVEKITEIYNRSKINLTFTGVAPPSMLKRDWIISKRLKQFKANIEAIALCGGFVLTEYAVATESKEIFEQDKEIVVFNTKEELLQEIRYYLKNEDERKHIAENGYKRALRDYDVSTALPALIQKLRKMNEEKKYTHTEIILDEIFLRNYATYRFPLMLKFLLSGKILYAFEELKIMFRIRLFDFYQIWYYLKRETIDRSPRLKKIIKRIFKKK